MKKFTSEYDQFFRDNLPFRSFFVNSFLLITENILESYELEYVTGKNRSLFMNHADQILDKALDVKPFDFLLQESLRLVAAGKYAFFYSKQIPFYLFLVPDKTTLYSELLPFYATWVKHDGWYKRELESLKQANIPYYDLKPEFDKHKKSIKFYDDKFDVSHWNGNAIKIAYDYMSRVLSKDYKHFSVTNDSNIFSVYDSMINLGPYGSDNTFLFKLTQNDSIYCKIPQNENYLLNVPYQKFCVNNGLYDGSLFLFSDSYFGQTHGIDAVTPFVYNFHIYWHSHYNLQHPFTTVLNQRIKSIKPDAVIEEFVERRGNFGYMLSQQDPLLRILGDIWLHTGGFIFDSSYASSDFEFYNCKDITADLHDNSSIRNVVVLDSDNNDPAIIAKPAMSDYLGRVVVMAKYSAPEDTYGQIFYWTDKDRTQKVVSFSVGKSSKEIHIRIKVDPFEKVYLRFDPGMVKGRYIFEDIPEVNDLRNRMKEDGI